MKGTLNVLCAVLAFWSFSSMADSSQLLIQIDKSEQTLTVFRDGTQYDKFDIWTGTSGLLSGTYKVKSLRPKVDTYYGNFVFNVICYAENACLRTGPRAERRIAKRDNVHSWPLLPQLQAEKLYRQVELYRVENTTIEFKN